MEQFISRASSDSELDSHRLRQMLDSLTAEIETPFLERRARSNALKKNPIEELSYVISELTNRERDIHACVGISKIILDKNDQVTQRVNKRKTKIEYYKNVVHELKNEAATLQGELQVAEEKNQQVNAALIKAEEQLISLLAEHKLLLKESSLKQEKTDLKSSEDQINEEVNELLIRYKEHDLQLQKKNKELEKNLQISKEEEEKKEGIIGNLKEHVMKIERELAKTKEKYKDLEDDLKETQDSKFNIDQKYKQLTFDYNRIKNRAEKLNEDIQIIESSNKPVVRKPKVRRHISLMSELEEISKEITAEITPEKTEPQFFLTSPRAGPRLFITTPATVAYITAKKQLNKRKSPLEEYFTLITQAVKLNSPYMDAICVIPPHELFEKAIQEDVPFHRWHIWVESKLTAAYIDLVYKNHSKKKGS